MSNSNANGKRTPWSIGEYTPGEIIQGQMANNSGNERKRLREAQWRQEHLISVNKELKENLRQVNELKPQYERAEKNARGIIDHFSQNVVGDADVYKNHDSHTTRQSIPVANNNLTSLETTRENPMDQNDAHNTQPYPSLLSVADEKHKHRDIQALALEFAGSSHSLGIRHATQPYKPIPQMPSKKYG